MKKLVFAAAICLAAIASVIVSCKKNEHDDMNHDSTVTEKNINYPAAYIVNGGSNTISVIDLATETVKETIELNGATFPHHIYLSPDKATMAVAITSTDLSGGHGGHTGGTGGYKVLIIDAVKGTIHHEIALTKLPHNAVYSPDGKELWVSQADMQSSVNVYNTTDYSLIKSIAVGGGLSETTFSTDGSKVFAANTMDSSVSVINPATKMVDKTIAVGGDPVGAWPGMNGYMYVDNEHDQTISEIKVSNLTVTATINLGFKPGYVAFYHHTDELWVSDATNGKVVYYKMQGGSWTKIGEITTGADAHAIAFNTDGSKAYVTNQSAGTVSVINPTTHQVTKTITVGTKPNGVIFKQ